jgi:hypothetical protein
MVKISSMPHRGKIRSAGLGDRYAIFVACETRCDLQRELRAIKSARLLEAGAEASEKLVMNN